MSAARVAASRLVDRLVAMPDAGDHGRPGVEVVEKRSRIPFQPEGVELLVDGERDAPRLDGERHRLGGRGTRAQRSSRSSRARACPRQKWGPYPKLRWRASARPVSTRGAGSKRSGSVNRVGSRFAA
jgi:hypothetical protein